MITTPLEGCHTTQGLSHLRLLQSSTLSHLVPCSAVGKFLLGSLILQRCRTMGHHWHLVPDVPDMPNMPNVPRGAQTCSDMPRHDQLGLQIEVKCFRLSSLFFFLWGGLPEALYISNKSFRNTTRSAVIFCSPKFNSGGYPPLISFGPAAACTFATGPNHGRTLLKGSELLGRFVGPSHEHDIVCMCVCVCVLMTLCANDDIVWWGHERCAFNGAVVIVCCR